MEPVSAVVGLVVAVEPLIDMVLRLRDSLSKQTGDVEEALEAIEEALDLLELLKELDSSLEKKWGEKKRKQIRGDLNNRQHEFKEYLDKRKLWDRFMLKRNIKDLNKTLTKLHEESEVMMNVAQMKHNRSHGDFMDRTGDQLGELHKKHDEQRQVLERLVEASLHEPTTTFDDEEWDTSVKRSKVTDHEDVEDLAKRMCNQETDELEAEKIAWVLCQNAAKTTDGNGSNWGDAIEVLVDALGTEDPKHWRRRTFAARVLRRLQINAPIADEIVPHLVEMVRPNSHIQETTAACALLANLAREEEKKTSEENTLWLALEANKVRGRPIVGNLVEKLVKMVRTGSQHQQKLAADVLRELAFNESCADTICESGGIKTLVDLLYIGHSSEHRCAALGALWRLAVKKAARVEIVLETGVDAIVEQLRVEGSDEQYQLAASTLAVLAWDDTSDELIGAAGGVELLVRLLRSGTANQRISSVHALNELANNVQNATKMVNAKAVRPLVASLRGGSGPEFRSEAGGALALIAKYTMEKRVFVNEIGINTIKDLLMMKESEDAVLCSERVIAAVCGEVERVQDALGTEDVVTELLNHVNVDSGGPDHHLDMLVSISALAALRALADCDTKIKSTIKGAGGVGVLTKLLERVRNDTLDELYIGAAEVLVCITNPHELKEALGEVELLLTVLENGSSGKKISTATLVAELVPEAQPEELIDIAKALGRALQTHRDESELVGALVQALLKVVTQDGTALREHPDTCQLLVEMLGETLVDDSDPTVSSTRKLVASTLSILTKDARTSRVLMSAGIIGVYSKAVSRNGVKLVCVRGLATLADRIGVASRTVKCRFEDWEPVVGTLVNLLDDSNPRVQVRAAKALSSLSRNGTIAKKIGEVDNVEKLVSAAKGEWSSLTKPLLRILGNLCDNRGNVVNLVDADLCGGVVDRMKEAKGTKDLQVVFELLQKLSAYPKAAARLVNDVMIELIEHCVRALRKKSEQLRHLGLTVLLNLYDYAAGHVDDDDGDEEENHEEASEDEASDEEESDEEESEEEESDDDDSDEEDDAEEFLKSISTKGRIKSVLNMWSKVKEDRPRFIRLLDALASRDFSCRTQIRDHISADILVEIVSNGTEDERVGAASVLSALVKDKKYREKATKAGAAGAFVNLIVTHEDKMRVKKATRKYLNSLHGRNEKELLESLLSKAGGSDTARELLKDLTSDASQCASLMAACATVLESEKSAVSSVLKLVKTVCKSKVYKKVCATKEMDSFVEELVSLFETSEQGSRLAITRALYDVADRDIKVRQSKRIGVRCMKMLVKMAFDADEDSGNRTMAFKTLAALSRGHSSNVRRILKVCTIRRILKFCKQCLDDDEKKDIVSSALTLVTALVVDNDEALDEKNLEKNLEIIVHLKDTKDAEPWIRVVEEFAQYTKASKFFVEHGVKEILTKLSKKSKYKRATAAALAALD